ncbi:hypothetical protein [Nonomuraea sp. NPDC050783]|uniref:hypothetical protein n=1 Tax=Nonomuraea sp. NPDC050783 TaxID=3154634 RepID=UPI0034673512
MRPRHLSRRALLAGGAAALTACSSSGTAPGPSAPASDSPETALVKGLIAEKERTIALYSSLIDGDGGDRLAPFRDRHQAHLDELRKHVTGAGGASAPPTASPPAASPSASGAPSGSAEPEKPSLSRLRELERKAAARRAKQLAAVSPGMAQLIASIGACEAVHATALPRSL